MGVAAPAGTLAQQGFAVRPRPPSRGSLLWTDVPCTRAATRTPRGGLGDLARFFPRPMAFPDNGAGRLLFAPDTDFCRGRVTTLQCSLHAAARVLACPPVSVRLGATLRPTRAFTSELPRNQVTSVTSRIPLHGINGRHRDWTLTGWIIVFTA